MTEGSNWTPRVHIGALGIIFGASRLPLGELGSSLIAFGGHFVSPWMPEASKPDAAGDQADIANTDENHRLSEVLEGWRMVLESWRGSGLDFWHTGWQLAGLLVGWLAVADAGLEAA